MGLCLGFERHFDRDGLPLTAGLLALFYGGAATLTAIALTLLYAAVGVYLNTRKAANEGAIIELISKHAFNSRARRSRSCSTAFWVSFISRSKDM